MSTLHAPNRIDRKALVDGIVSDVAKTFAAASLSQGARDLYEDTVSAASELVAAGDQLERDFAELDSKRDLLPQAGYERLRSEARAEAHMKSKSAGLRFDRSYQQLKEALVDDALPVFAPEREILARQELSIAIGEAQGGAARERALAVVRGGSREAVAVLLRSEFGRTLLESRGVSGRDLDELMTSGRTIAAGLAGERGTTDRERAARAALSRWGTLGAARGAAGQVGPRDGR